MIVTPLSIIGADKHGLGGINLTTRRDATDARSARSMGQHLQSPHQRSNALLLSDEHGRERVVPTARLFLASRGGSCVVVPCHLSQQRILKRFAILQETTVRALTCVRCHTAHDKTHALLRCAGVDARRAGLKKFTAWQL